MRLFICRSRKASGCAPVVCGPGWPSPFSPFALQSKGARNAGSFGPARPDTSQCLAIPVDRTRLRSADRRSARGVVWFAPRNPRWRDIVIHRFGLAGKSGFPIADCVARRSSGHPSSSPVVACPGGRAFRGLDLRALGVRLGTRARPPHRRCRVYPISAQSRRSRFLTLSRSALRRTGRWSLYSYA